MALGASRRPGICEVLLQRGCLLTAIGGALGLVGALAASACPLRDLLYGVAPNDTDHLRCR